MSRDRLPEVLLLKKQCYRDLRGKWGSNYPRRVFDFRRFRNCLFLYEFVDITFNIIFFIFNRFHSSRSCNEWYLKKSNLFDTTHVTGFNFKEYSYFKFIYSLFPVSMTLQTMNCFWVLSYFKSPVIYFYGPRIVTWRKT